MKGGAHMDFYDRFKQLLALNNVTRKQLCLDLGISYHTLSALMQRRTERMPLEMVQKIAKYLNTTVDYLAFGETEKPKGVDDEIIDIVKSLSNTKKNELLKFAKYLKSEM